jgi:hypothetical protein
MTHQNFSPLANTFRNSFLPVGFVTATAFVDKRVAAFDIVI